MQYIGNGAYCYANAGAMLLANIDETVSPGRLEVLTGVGLGALWIGEPTTFFLSYNTPDDGLSKAFDMLGFEYVEKSYPVDAPLPLQALQTDLEQGPVILGPLDMGHLTYLPYHANVGGADHYVLAYELEGDLLHLHDPDGFPYVQLNLADLEKAWRAEDIGYARVAFRSWTAPGRINNPPEAEIYAQAMAYFQSVYQDTEALAKKLGWTFGASAIEAKANHLRQDEVSQAEAGMLVNFVLPLGARRALDFAQFFTFAHPQLAQLKSEQAKLLGQSHSLAMQKDWPAVAQILEHLAQTETAFRAELLSVTEMASVV